MKFEFSQDKSILKYYSNFLVETSNNELILIDTASEYSWNFMKTKKNNDFYNLQFKLFDEKSGGFIIKHKLLSDKNNIFFVLNSYNYLFLFKLTKNLIPEEAIAFWNTEEVHEGFNMYNFFCYYKIDYLNCNYKLFLIKNPSKFKKDKFNLENTKNLFNSISHSDSINLYANYFRYNCSEYLLQFMEVEHENLFEYDSLIFISPIKDIELLSKKIESK